MRVVRSAWRERMRRCQTGLAIVAFYTAAGVAATWPLVVHLSEALPADFGDPALNAWILAWDADRLLHGLRGLWDAPYFHPYSNTLAYTEHLLGIAIFTAPVQWLTGNPVAAYNVAFLASFVLAGSGMHLLTQSLTNSRAAGLIGGVAFAFLPWRADQTSHIQVLMYGWMPIALWALHRYFSRGSRTALAVFAAAFLLQGFSNGYYFYFFAAAVIVVAGVEVVSRLRSRPVMLAELAVALAVMLAVTAPVAIGYLDARDAAGLMQRSQNEMVAFSADLQSYFDAAPDTVWRDVLSGASRGKALFPGFGVLALAAIGLVGAASLRQIAGTVRFAAIFVAVGVVGFIVSLGPESADGGTVLYDFLLGFVPGFDGLRVPARAAIVVFLSLTVLAAFGARFVVGCLTRTRSVMFCLVATSILVIEGYHPIRMVPFDLPPDTRAAHRWLRDRPPGAVVDLPFTGWGREVITTIKYMHGTLEHGHPIVNGYSGYRPHLLQAIQRQQYFSNFALYGDLLTGLRAIGVRYVLVHEALFEDAEEGRATVEAIGSNLEQWTSHRRVGATAIFELALFETPVRAPPDGAPLAPGRMRLTASRAPDRLSLAVDGDIVTRWMTERAQAGDEWVKVAFERPTDVAHVRLWLAPDGQFDYPRHLIVEGSADGESFEELYAGRGFPVMFAGMPRAEVGAVPLDFALPPNRARVLRLRQTGSDATFYWSIHEMSVWER